jgi:hypothetical protein
VIRSFIISKEFLAKEFLADLGFATDIKFRMEDDQRRITER